MFSIMIGIITVIVLVLPTWPVARWLRRMPIISDGLKRLAVGGVGVFSDMILQWCQIYRLFLMSSNLPSTLSNLISDSLYDVPYFQIQLLRFFMSFSSSDISKSSVMNLGRRFLGLVSIMQKSPSRSWLRDNMTEIGENGAFPPTRNGCIHSLSMRERG